MPSDSSRLPTSAEPTSVALEPRLEAPADSGSLEPATPPAVPSGAVASRVRDREALERIKRFIDQNLGNVDLSPKMICADIGVSRSQLYRLFSGGIGVAGYIRVRRLLKAHAALVSSAQGIASVARVCGFSSHAHFSRVFKRQFGYTPWQCAVEGRAILAQRRRAVPLS